MAQRLAAKTDQASAPSLGRPVRALFLEITLNVGGAERILGNLIQSFDRTRVQPSVVLLRDPGKMAEQLKASDVPIYHNLGKSRADPRMLGALIKVIRKERPDVIYTCNYPMTMFYGRVAGLLAGTNSHVVGLHSIGYITRAKWRAFSLRCMSPFITRMVAVSEGQKSYYAETQGIPASKIEVILGAVDLDRFRPDIPAGPLRAEFGVPEDAIAVGILAGMRPEKRHDQFLEMARRVVAKRRDVCFFIVGDGPERPKLEAMADEHKLRPSVQFVGNRADVPSVLKSLDISVLCSDPVVETLPQCLLESMAAGLPVVSTSVGSIDELVVDGTTGFLVPMRDVEGLADRVLRLVDNPEMMREMGLAGRRRVEEYFSKELMVRRFEELFERLALERKAH